MADIEARVNENSPIGFFTWCWTIVVEITDGRMVVPTRPGLGLSLSEQVAVWTRERAQIGKRS